MFAGREPRLRVEAKARTTNGCNMLWNGAFSRDASGENSIQHFTNWNIAGGRLPESPTPIGPSGRPKTERTIHSLRDVHDAVNYYVNAIPYDQILSTATHISTDINFRVVSVRARWKQQ
jgi:hypothetical protein